MSQATMQTKVQIIVSKNGSWIWRAEADLDPEIARPLSEAEFKLVRAALPKLLKEMLAGDPVQVAPQPKRKK